MCYEDNNIRERLKKEDRWLLGPKDKKWKDPLFCRPGTIEPMTYNIIRKGLIQLFKALGLSTALLCTHSLRSGARSAALAAGVDKESVMRQGGWISEAINCYLFPTMKVLLGPTKSLRL